MNLKLKDYLLVFIQLALFVIYFYELDFVRMKSSSLFIFIGIVMCFAGILVLFIAIFQLNKNLSPFPTPKHDGELIQNGLYKYIRHPIYTGIIFSTLGYGIHQASESKISISILLIILFIIKSRYEENQLEIKFKNYRSYRSRTGRFLPKLRLQCNKSN